MKTPLQSLACLLGLSLISGIFLHEGSPCLAQEKKFPSDSGIVNITSYGVDLADNSNDDTQKILQAIKDNIGRSKIIYFPNGVYNINNTLEWKNSSGRWGAYLSFQGQSRANTIFKLRNNTFTSTGAPKAVIKTADDATEEGNEAFRNSIQDITVNTGTGNTGAIGIDWLANNRGILENVTIQSGDGQGLRGLSLMRVWQGPCLVKNVSISGFNYGIDVNESISSVTFEHITLSNQKVIGLRNQDNVVTVRNLKSTNNVPVIQNLDNRNGYGRRGLVTVLDGNFTGTSGASTKTAIVNESGLYVRNLVTSGYRAAIRHYSNDVSGASHGEWSDHVASLSGATQGLNLGVRETPGYWNNDMTQWAKVGSRNSGETDDTPRIQRAIDSGKPVVYFTPGDYFLRDTVIVRGSVRHIVGMEAHLRPASSHSFSSSKALIRFDSPSSSIESVLLERINLFGNDLAVMGIEHNSTKTVVLKDMEIWDCAAPSYSNRPGVGPLFIEDVASAGAFHSGFVGGWRFSNPQSVWARQFNPEHSNSPMVYNNGGKLWVLGMKTEREPTVLENRGRGHVEILGGCFVAGTVSSPSSTTPCFINHESSLSTSYVTAFADYNVHVRETREGVVRELSRNNVPDRDTGYLSLVSLYTSKAANLLKNASFDEQNFDTQQISWWDEWSIDGQGDASFTQRWGGSNSGERHLTHWRNPNTGLTTYGVSTRQSLFNLPTGNYTLRAWARRGAGHRYAYIQASGGGVTQKGLDIPVSNDYQLLVISDIYVSSGYCQIEVYSEGIPDQWLDVDDIEFYRQ
jgi:hypothetical protein